MSLRKDMHVLSDDELMKVHDKAQREVSSLLQGGFLNLTTKHTKIAKAAEREILSRMKFRSRVA